MAPNATKTPKGTRDLAGKCFVLRESIFRTATKVFECHGGVPLDTPVFELREILTEKYGEDSQLIYNLEDQGGEACSLRYDLTVPFARWLAQNGVKKIKRYQIAKVYRRDQPAIARGRLREFYQCDFDIAGVYEAMIPDARVLSITAEVFEALKIDVTIKINHRKILDGMFAAVRVPQDKIRLISSAVDKLDKSPWADVRREMVEEKGLAGEIADRIGEIVRQSGSLPNMIDTLRSNTELSANTSIKEGLDDMSLLLSYLQAMRIVEEVTFDLSLARGLDYYTGLIYEVVPRSTNPNLPSGMGSIAAGGRYDDLVGMFGNNQIPCVGISFGIERIFTILERREPKDMKSNLRPEFDVYILALASESPGGLLPERMAAAQELSEAGIKADYAEKTKPSQSYQFEASRNVPVAIFLGDEDLAAGKVRIKLVGSNSDAHKDKNELVLRSNMVEEVRKLLLTDKI